MNITSSYIGDMKTALDAYSMRNKAINGNLANSDTPHYKRKYVKFEEYLSRANENYSLRGARTNEKHMYIPQINEKGATIAVDNSVSAREDGNNVNVDVEEVDSVKNYINYNAIADQMSAQFRSLISGITGGRR